MASNRSGRINEEIRRELSELLREMKDPRMNKGLVSITGVNATGDLRYCKVHISVFNKEDEKEVMKVLKNASGFLRRELGSRLRLRYTPELIFEADDSIVRGTKVIEMLGDLNTSESDGE
ncbi:MAG: 30S ribosome-binding factor RbfA [Ruminococcaceae bacterium]|nr:30S ribosome-binding factor RbfA [Oscillospiraceae bacterium]